MSSPFIGEVRLVGFSFAPLNWSTCAGQTVAISQNEALFNLIGTTYGGDGQSTFQLPDLQGRVPVHQGNGYAFGQRGGVESVTITSSTYPSHNHTLVASSNQGGSNSPGNNLLGQLTDAYSNQTPSSASTMNASVLGNASGSNLPHDNMQPYLVLNWIIALYGVYPSPS